MIASNPFTSTKLIYILPTKQFPFLDKYKQKNLKSKTLSCMAIGFAYRSDASKTDTV